MWQISLVGSNIASSPGAETATSSVNSSSQRIWEEVHFFGESPPTCCTYIYKTGPITLLGQRFQCILVKTIYLVFKSCKDKHLVNRSS